jgi:hypothetical protein
MPQRRLRGEDSPRAKISEPQARLILSSRLGEKGLARALSISRTEVYRIRRGVCWGHLSEPHPAA